MDRSVDQEKKSKDLLNTGLGPRPAAASESTGERRRREEMMKQDELSGGKIGE